MKSTTMKLMVGTLASLAAMGMTGGAAFAGAAEPISEARDEAVTAARDRQWHAGETLKHPLSPTSRITGWVSHARAAAGNVASEAQR